MPARPSRPAHDLLALARALAATRADLAARVANDQAALQAVDQRLRAIAGGMQAAGLEPPGWARQLPPDRARPWGRAREWVEARPSGPFTVQDLRRAVQSSQSVASNVLQWGRRHGLCRPDGARGRWVRTAAPPGPAAPRA